MARRTRKERWRQIPDFNWYDVSSLGRIRSWKPDHPSQKKARTKPKIMRTRLDRDNYPRITLQDDKGKKRVVRIHNLVARAFLGPAKGRLVLHKKNKRGKAHLENLEYGSYEDNNDDKYISGTHQMGENNSRAEVTKKQAKEIYRLKGKMTQMKIAERYDVSRQAVSDIHRGITWAEATGV
jgi:hypothetical protein